MSLDHSAGFVKRQTTTQDMFLGGLLTIIQPKKGFRAGLDSILLGVSVAPQSQDLLELGAGVGTAAMTAMAHNKDLYALLAEIDPELAGLAQKNLHNNKYEDRSAAIALDITANGKSRLAAGLKSDYFSTIIANPPYFDAAEGTQAPNKSRATARHMHAEALDKWVRTAAACAISDGEVIFIYRAGGLPGLLEAFGNRFGAITILPIAPRAAQNATRILVRGIKGSRAPMVLKSPLILHGDQGRDFLPEVDAIFRGQARLHW